MSANDYHFISHWRVAGTCGEVADILGDPLALARWWPSVYLAVDEIRSAGADGLGQRVRLRTKGWLPYSIAWEFEVVESRYPHGFTIVASGDFEGLGIWTLEQDGRFVDAIYDWRLTAEKPLLRHLSFLLKPVFEANHRWAMAQGEASLELELQRRRATSEEALATIPPPPGPVTYAGVALVAGAAFVGGTLAVLMMRASRKKRTQRPQRTQSKRKAV